MKVIDSHVHFWQPELLNYIWIKNNDLLERAYLPEDLQTFSGENMPDKLVFIEAGCDSPTLEEVAFIESLANDAPFIAGIVAHAPLEDGDSVRLLLAQLAERPLVKGVRRLIQSEASGFSTQPDFIAGVQTLADYDLTFDLCVYHHQLPDVISLVKQCPQVNFVLNHIGKPNIKDELLDPWRENIKTLAEFDNVYCKLSGLVTEADPNKWKREHLKPYIDHIFEAFGINRVMFGSDWPVLRGAGSYTGWVDVLKWALSDLSEDEQNAFYFDNAEKFYRLT